MDIFIACDHAAFSAKRELVAYLKRNFHVEDLGTHSSDSCHYPHFAIELVKKVLQENKKGILMCGSGIGMSMAANRFKGIRAALCHSSREAKLSREHNDANILCLGAVISPLTDMIRITETWLTTHFCGGRHSERLAIFTGLGEETISSS